MDKEKNNKENNNLTRDLSITEQYQINELVRAGIRELRTTRTQ